MRGDGASAISDALAHAKGGNGALRQSFTNDSGAGSGKTDFRIFADAGPVGELSAASFDWYRDSASDTAAFLAPAVGIYVDNGLGDSWLLKWEAAYNGGAVDDTWVTSDLQSGNFWRIPQVVGGVWVGFSGCNLAGDPYGCFQFDRSLSDTWLDRFHAVGIEIGIGSGWAGTTHISYADHVVLGDMSWDFEPEAADVVLTSKEECFSDGWATSTSPVFKNQGQCVAFFQANERANK